MKTTLPLLMSFTPATRITEEVEIHKIIYDEGSQTVYDMRLLGTKSLKKSITHKKTKQGSQSVGDQKNEIDDHKTVK